ncbi:MAG: hypothetical protein KGP14_15420, partial [Betaproteobacteria bacterium]|nr:hypothetical protein [Betaproteobacteria bacterium]
IQDCSLMKTFADQKLPGEKVVLTFDFTSALNPTETLTGTAQVSVTVRSGNDTNPLGLLNGSASADQTGKLLLVPVQGGNDSTDYVITAIAQTTNAFKSPGLSGVLSVRA